MGNRRLFIAIHPRTAMTWYSHIRSLISFALVLLMMQYGFLFRSVRYDVFTLWERQELWQLDLTQHDILTQAYLYMCTYLIWVPMISLYLNGPNLYGVGFWQGKPMDEICYRLTDLWTRSSSDAHAATYGVCHDKVFHQTEAFVVTMHSLATLVFLCLSFFGWFVRHQIMQLAPLLRGHSRSGSKSS
jgi:hypothetical protein